VQRNAREKCVDAERKPFVLLASDLRHDGRLRREAPLPLRALRVRGFDRRTVIVVRRHHATPPNQELQPIVLRSMSSKVRPCIDDRRIAADVAEHWPELVVEPAR
jgi:hypothetical protein